MRVFAFALLAGLMVGCGSSETSSGVTAAPASAPVEQRLTGAWLGQDVSLTLNEVNGVVGGVGQVGDLPVHVTGGRLADGQVALVLLPADASTETNNLPANGQVAPGSLRLRLANRDVELRPAVGERAQSSGRYLADAPPYRIALDLDTNVWTSNTPLLGGSSGTLLYPPDRDGNLVFALMDGSGNPSGQLLVSGEAFPGPTRLARGSVVLTPQFDNAFLNGTFGPDTSGPLAAAPVPSPPAVGGIWAGPDFKLDVTQTGGLLSAAGTYRVALLRGTGRAGVGLFLNTLFGESGVDGVTILRPPGGPMTVIDSARGTTETVASKLWDDNLQTTGDFYQVSASPPEQTFQMLVTGTTPSGFTGTWGPDYGQGKYQPTGTLVAFDQGASSTVILHFSANTPAVIGQFTFPRFSTGVPGTVPLAAGEYLGERSLGSARLVRE